MDLDNDLGGSALNIRDCCIAVIASRDTKLDPVMKTWFGLASRLTHFEDEPSAGAKIAKYFAETQCAFTIVMKGHF